MLTFLIFIVAALVACNHGVPVEQESESVAMDLMVPRGTSREEYLQSIADYWTHERMESAIEKDLIITDEQEFLRFNNEPRVERAAMVLTTSQLLSGTVASKPKVAGKVYFVMNGANYIWIFVPEYNSGSRPLGTFIMRKMVTNTAWMNSGNFNFDIAIVLMNNNEKGQHIQDVTGGLGITLDSPQQAKATSFGYPKNINNGEIVSNCAGTHLSPTNVAGFTGLRLACTMTGGSSGGP
ncbi:unnamed protein product [Rotaria sp. Silwood2]|nr:unnamed protein product [Rotaria sp. Silwood2]